MDDSSTHLSNSKSKQITSQGAPLPPFQLRLHLLGSASVALLGVGLDQLQLHGQGLLLLSGGRAVRRGRPCRHLTQMPCPCPCRAKRRHGVRVCVQQQVRRHLQAIGDETHAIYDDVPCVCVCVCVCVCAYIRSYHTTPYHRYILKESLFEQWRKLLSAESNYN